MWQPCAMRARALAPTFSSFSSPICRNFFSTARIFFSSFSSVMAPSAASAAPAGPFAAAEAAAAFGAPGSSTANAGPAAPAPPPSAAFFFLASFFA